MLLRKKTELSLEGRKSQSSLGGQISAKDKNAPTEVLETDLKRYLDGQVKQVDWKH